MQANELRLGNWIKRDSQPDGFLVNAETINRMYYSGARDEEPIPLTEEWLVKFGFEKENPGTDWESWTHKLDGVGLSPFKGSREKENILTINNTSFKEDESDKGFYIELYYCYIHIKHVHQLQNVFFALSGEELTIK
jgi:hypothetical protein